jgi:hypothetical protein
MNTENSAVKPRGWGKKLLIFTGWAVAGLVALSIGASWIWHNSGSNQWELAQQSPTAKVYTLKSPGSDRLLLKANYTARASLSQIVAGFKDPGVCQFIGCQARLLEHVDDELDYVYMKLPGYAPFKPRDFVLRIMTHQNPVTKEVMVEVAAVQDRVPLDPCCVRVVNMNNIWKLTPAGNGRVDVEFIINADVGGLLPDVLTNLSLPRALTGVAGFQRLYDAKRYRDVKLAYIREPDNHS